MKRQINVLGFLNLNDKDVLKQFLLTLLATTISIILTFGTSAIINNHEKEKAKKEMVMMIIYDFDKTIEQIQRAEAGFHQASERQQLIALHPEYYDSLRMDFTDAVKASQMDFSETTEKIFSSNIETFNTLGNVNFVHEVSNFYSLREHYRKQVLDVVMNTVNESPFTESIENLFQFDFPDCYYMTKVYLCSLQKSRDLCMKMMKVKEEEMKEFSQLRLADEKNSDEEVLFEQELVDELMNAEAILFEAKNKLEQNK